MSLTLLGAMHWFLPILEVQCNLDLVTLNFVTTCDLVTILQTPFSQFTT